MIWKKYGPKAYKFIGFGDIHGQKANKSIVFGDIILERRIAVAPYWRFDSAFALERTRNKERERETERQRETERDTERQRERERERDETRDTERACYVLVLWPLVFARHPWHQSISIYWVW